MKICDLTQAYTETSGGIRTYIDAKRDHLVRDTNHHHILIIPGRSDSCKIHNRYTIYQVAAPVIPNCEPYRFTLRINQVYKILKKEKPDIIELGTPYLLPWAAFYYSWSQDCRIIGYYHTDFPSAYVRPAMQQIFGKNLGMTAENLATWYAKLIFGSCDGVLTNSKSHLCKLNKLVSVPINYIPLGVDTTIFHPGKRNPNIRKKLKLTKDDLLLIYTGRFDIEKKVNQIIEAFEVLEKNQNFFLLLIGDGPLKSRLLQRARLNQRIRILPFIHDKHLLAEYLASADFYLTAGPHETFGLSILEAQAAGLPVVGVAAGALKERVSEKTGILGPPDDPHTMAANILQLSSENFRGKGIAARKLIENTYSWEYTFKKTVDFYEKLKSDPETKTQIRAVYRPGLRIEKLFSEPVVRRIINE